MPEDGDDRVIDFTRGELITWGELKGIIKTGTSNQDRIIELESNYECQRENNNESISAINQMFLKHQERIEKLEDRIVDVPLIREKLIELEQKLEEQEQKRINGWNDYKFLQDSQIKRQDYLDERIEKLEKDKDGEKEPTDIAGSARQTEKKDSYYPIWLTKDEIIVEKADLEWLFEWILTIPHKKYISELLIKKDILIEKYLEEKK